MSTGGNLYLRGGVGGEAHACPGCVCFRHDLPDSAPVGSLCVVTEGSWADMLFARTTEGWAWLGNAPEQSTADRVRRRPVECGACGAPVSPHAERCEYCGAWLEVER